MLRVAPHDQPDAVRQHADRGVRLDRHLHRIPDLVLRFHVHAASIQLDAFYFDAPLVLELALRRELRFFFCCPTGRLGLGLGPQSVFLGLERRRGARRRALVLDRAGHDPDVAIIR